MENLTTDIRHDLHDARALLEHAGTEEEKKKYRKAAEIILLKALRQDPDNIEAQMLLQGARATPVSPRMIAVQQPPQPAAPQESQEEPPFIAAAPLFQTLHPEKRKKRKPNLLMGLIATAAVGAGLVWLLQSHHSATNALAAPLPAAAAPTVVSTSSPAKLPQPAPETPAPAVASAPAVATPQPAATTPQPAAPAVANTNVAIGGMGKLAVSSPVAAEIYEGNRQLGSTPTTLELPVGRHTLEYRHGDLRTTMNHEIKSGGTTTASIAFQTTIQINAKPWAQVFLDGNSRRLLGQTPLSGVTVPIGGVLVFENPGFASQTRRITEGATTIQVDFQ